MEFDVQSLLHWFSGYAYQPVLLYTAVALLFTASSFGLPVPEEVMLVSLGLLAYLAKRPDQFPPPFPGAMPVSVEGLMVAAFLAVFLSDSLVFLIGKHGGKRLRKSRRWKKFFRSRAFRKSEVYARHHGAIMAGIFRFTPGLRFPGHMICGMMKLPYWKFVAADGTAALFTVPTQIWLVATYGEHVVVIFRQFKIAVLLALGIGLLIFFGRRWYLMKQEAKSA